MFLIKARVFVLSFVSRDSFLFRIGRFLFRVAMKFRELLAPPGPKRVVDDNSIFREEDELWMCSLFPRQVLDLAIEMFHPRTVLDVGCGTGVSLNYLTKRGVEVSGVEGSELAISSAMNPERIQIHDLHKPLDLHRRFDLVWCYEVAEHIHPDYVEVFLDSLARHSDTLLLSAAKPGQGGCGHLNEQLPAYWIDKMQQRGFAYDVEGTRKFHLLSDPLIENIMIFQKMLEKR